MKTSLQNLTISLLALVWPMDQLSAQNLSTEAVDPLLKGSVERFTSAINSTLQSFSVEGKIFGEELATDGEHLLVATKVNQDMSQVSIFSTADVKKLYSIRTMHRRSFMTSKYLALHSSVGLDVYDINTGEHLWNIEAPGLLLGGPRSAIMESNGSTINVLYNTEDTVLLANKTEVIGYALATGDRLFATPIPPKSNFSMIADGICLVSSENGTNSLFDAATGKITPLDIPAEISTLKMGENGLLYVADTKNLYCLDSQNHTHWTASLPKGKPSLSHLYLVGDTVVYFNMGGQVKGDKYVPKSVPYVAAFNAHDGSQYWLTPLADKKQLYTCIYATNGIGYACSGLNPSRLFRISLSDGHLQPMQWNADNCGQFKVLSWGDYYHIDRTTNHFQNAGFGFDCALNMTEDVFRVSADEAPKLIAHGTDVYKSHKTLANGMQYVYCQTSKDMWIISADGQPLYRFPKNLRGFYIERNTILFFTDDDHYGVIRFPEE